MEENFGKKIIPLDFVIQNELSSDSTNPNLKHIPNLEFDVGSQILRLIEKAIPGVELQKLSNPHIKEPNFLGEGFIKKPVFSDKEGLLYIYTYKNAQKQYLVDMIAGSVVQTSHILKYNEGKTTAYFSVFNPNEKIESNLDLKQLALADMFFMKNIFNDTERRLVYENTHNIFINETTYSLFDFDKAYWCSLGGEFDFKKDSVDLPDLQGKNAINIIEILKNKIIKFNSIYRNPQGFELFKTQFKRSITEKLQIKQFFDTINIGQIENFVQQTDLEKFCKFAYDSMLHRAITTLEAINEKIKT